MRISYQWTEREWDEAVRLANRTAAARPGLPGMTYALVGIPLVGAVLDLRSTIHTNKGITLAGSILPMLLLLVAVTAAVLIAVVSLSRKRKRERVADMPGGDWELVMQEGGWRCASQETPLRPWSDLVEARQGQNVIVFVHREGFAAVPTRSLTPEQGGHMHRMVVRKLKPSV